MIIIVVYKENSVGMIVADQLKKLVSQNYTHPNSAKALKIDDEINVVPMEEKVYYDNLKVNPIIDKVLYVEGVKRIKELIPIAEIKYNDYGVIYSFAGPQALLTADPKKLYKDKVYANFVKELNELTYQKIEPMPTGINRVLDGIKYGILGHKKRYKNLMKQQLIFGITKFYYNDLIRFLFPDEEIND